MAKKTKSKGWLQGLEGSEMMLVGIAALLAIIGLVLMFMQVL